MENLNNLTFNEFCEKVCDGLYEPRLSFNVQSTGYKRLRKMVEEKIKPASLEEIDRWEKNPTVKELLSTPDIKYLRFLHPVLRPLIVKNWDKISKMKINN